MKEKRKRPDLTQKNIKSSKYYSFGIKIKEKDRRLYKIWDGIKERCLNKNSKDYVRYGLRNIKICSEWLESFVCFYNWAYTNGYNDTLTIDRIDSNGNYEPSNCRWVNLKEQARNRRNNRLITYENQTHCISEWAEIKNIPRKCLEYRVRNWDNLDRIFNRPVTKNSKI